MKLKIVLASLLLAAPIPSFAQEEPDHLYWFSAADDDAPRPWAVILPGGGGIDNFGDEGAYYFEFAEWLNERGIDALVVHYQEDSPPVDAVGIQNYGGEQAAVVDRAVAFGRGLGRMDMRCDGLVFGWSMGGEGTLELAGRPREALPGLTAAYAYYPSVQGRPEGFEARVPVTVLQGDADTFTPLPAFYEFMGASENPEAFALHTFGGAKHGFDVYTVPEPVLGGGFAYDRENALAAKAMLGTMLDEADYGCALD